MNYKVAVGSLNDEEEKNDGGHERKVSESEGERNKEREKDELICQAIRAIAGSTKLHLVPFLLLQIHSLPRLDLSYVFRFFLSLSRERIVTMTPAEQNATFV